MGSFVVAFRVMETEDAWVFQANLPGVAAEDVRVTIADDHFTVSGRYESETTYRYGGPHRGFLRSISIPEEADVSRAHAELKDGGLAIIVPKATARPRPVLLAAAG
jgi:HSP20 family protein